MSLDKWMTKLTKDFGKLASEIPRPSEHVIKMPSPSMNWMVGNGGITEGKAVTLFGPESGGKSLLMQLILIQIQRQYPESLQVLFDAEFSFNPAWFEKLGGDSSRLIVRQSNDPVDIFDYIMGEMDSMIQDGAPINALAIDSIRSIRYPKDVKKQTTDIIMGGSGAPYLTSTLKGVTPVIRKHGITTIFVQQVNEEMDQYKKMRNPWIIPDGRALKHFSDYMLQVEKLETKKHILTEGTTITGGDQQVGHKVRVKGSKNRLGAPYRVAEFSLDYERGIVDTEGELTELAKSLGVLYHPISAATGKMNNMMWQFAEYSPIKGYDNMVAWIKDSPQVQEEIYKACTGVNAEALAARNELVAMTDNVDVNLDDL